MLSRDCSSVARDKTNWRVSAVCSGEWLQMMALIPILKMTLGSDIKRQGWARGYQLQ